MRRLPIRERWRIRCRDGRALGKILRSSLSDWGLMVMRYWNRRQFMGMGAAAMGARQASGHSVESFAAIGLPPTVGRGSRDTESEGSVRDLDVWIFAGQSNSQGWALLKAPVEPDSRILVLNEQNQWVLAEEPLNKNFYGWTPPPVDENILLQRDHLSLPGSEKPEEFLRQQSKLGSPLGGVGPGLFFAKHVLKHTDRPLGLIFCGMGGPIKLWDTGPRQPGGQSLYWTLLDKVHAAGGNVRGVVWWQGESDGLTTGAPEAYEAAFLNVIDAIRSGIGNPNLPFIYVQVGRFVHPYDFHATAFERIREIQRQVASKRHGLSMVSPMDLQLEDAIHMSFEGYQALGARLGELALSQVYEMPGHATPITFGSIEVLAPESRRKLIRVRFEGVNGRLQAAGRPSGFELRTARAAEDPSRFYPQHPSTDIPMHVIYRVDFDPHDPSAVILGVFDTSPILLGKPHPLTAPVSLMYGAGLNPYVNIVDDMQMPIPAFGPVEVKV